MQNWHSLPFYAFPPFAVVHRVLDKIAQDEATGVLVVPDWPTRSWYSMLARSTVQALSAGLPGIRGTLQARGFSSAAENYYLRSWRVSAQRQYRSSLSKWETFCGARGNNPFSPSLETAINFLADLALNNSSYSAINTARSALLAVLPAFGGHSFGNHPDVHRVMKGIFESNPPTPR